MPPRRLRRVIRILTQAPPPGFIPSQLARHRARQPLLILRRRGIQLRRQSPRLQQQPIELILFRQLATQLAVPVFLVDSHGDVIFLNEGAEQLLGIRWDDLEELPFERWTTQFRPRHPDGSAMNVEDIPLAHAVRHRRPAHAALRVVGTDGVDHVIEATAFPLEGSRGRLLGAVAMFWERDR